MDQIKRLLVFSFIIVLLIAGCCSAIANGVGEAILAPENPDFVDYLQRTAIYGTASFENGFEPGLVPEPIDLPQLNGISLLETGITAIPPAFFDLRTQSKLTPIRDQGSCGSCWAFASMGSLESSLMPTESFDSSENNLKNLAGFDLSCCSGGNRTMSTAYLTRWAGAIAESEDPYKAGSCVSPSGLISKQHVQEVIYLPTRSSPLDNDAIKQAVMTYGAVYTTYYHSNSYYNSSTRGYYYSGSGSANHAVCVVGWDDNFSRSNFLTPPPGDGAFIIRNSWGTYWGQSGYFYMSYYDGIMGKTENAVFRAEPASNYNTIYQYDTLGWVGSTGYGNTSAWFANVFTATSNSPIAAASWYAASPNSTYTIYIYTNPTSGPISSAGPVATSTGTLETAGYHTVRLASPVSVTAGQKFSVVVKVTTPGYNYPIPLERPYSGYASAAKANSGESYMSSTGTSWTDVASYYANTNVCLKAFASGFSVPTPGILSVSPTNNYNCSGTVGGPFTPGSQTYTLTNSGGTSIDWEANETQTWLSLSPTSGTLAPGMSTIVSVSINSSANALAVGTYSDTITFTNITNGSGNTTRSAVLTINSSAPAPGILSVTSTAGLSASGTVGGPFSPTSQTYTLKNTGQSSLNWTAGKAQSWVSLSAISGTLAPGATKTMMVSINSNANSLTAGIYTDTVTFANSTTGNGNTSRSVSLTVTSAPGTYKVVTTTFAWIDPTNHMKLTLGNDSTSYGVSIPFSFTFYGKAYKWVYVGSNGLLGFTSSGIYSYANTNLPASYYPNAAIYPYWDNLNPARGGSMRISTIGYTPNRKTVISWVDVPSYYSSTAKFTFQAILSEGTNDITFQYLNVSPTNSLYGAGRSATIGIENATGTQACKYSYNKTSVTNNSAIRFTTSSTTAKVGKIR